MGNIKAFFTDLLDLLKQVSKLRPMGRMGPSMKFYVDRKSFKYVFISLNDVYDVFMLALTILWIQK